MLLRRKQSTGERAGSNFNWNITPKYPFAFLTEFEKFSSSGVICQIKLEVLMLSVYIQIQLLYLNEAVDKVLIIAEVHVMLKKTKTRDSFDALYHYGPRVGDQPYPYYWSSKRPSAGCETPACKARGVLCYPGPWGYDGTRRLVHYWVSVLGATDCHKRVPAEVSKHG